MIRYIFISCLILLFFVHSSYAQQTQEQIKQQQQALQKELNELNTSLSEVKKSQKISLGQLKLIQNKISVRQSLIENISKDIKSLDGQIAAYHRELEKHTRELDTLKANYARSLVEAYKKRNSYDYINFLFSSKSFNDAIKRIQYLKSYRSFRDAQVNDIKATQDLIQKKLNSISTLKGNKNIALNTQSSQLKALETDKLDKDEAIKQLQGREGELSQEIAIRERQREQLRTLLRNVIRKEIAEAQRKERERLAKIAAARIAEEERLAKLERQKQADAQADKERLATYEKVKKEREDAQKLASEAERQRKITEERIAREKKEREDKLAREKKEMDERIAKEKADAKLKADRERQLKRIAERNKQIDEQNARDLAQKKAEEQKAKNEVKRLDVQVAQNNDIIQESKEDVKRRVEQKIEAEKLLQAQSRGRSYNVLESSNETMTQSLDFEKNKGALPWPASGYVSQPFGTYTLPGSKIKEYNPGIEITSSGSNAVRSVANGTVTVVVATDDGYTVIIRHGKYFTAYSHLSSVSVSKGQTVQSGSSLGTMAMGEEGKPTMLFMVSDDRGNDLNPSGWLR